ncbi:MAG: hypothetical protein CMO97_06275 [Woeseia sp.]|nr:hypothetical protein [Woeseia sp.]|tara:strand:- start:214 stop:765 length:552 start_codon:yes stop_codon:yes gene_type:complete
MTISTKMLNDSIKKISETNSLLDMLCEFEKVIDDADVYAYKNWDKGEVLEGPNLGRHFVSVKLLYKGKQMPDPDGAKRLLNLECQVKYNKDTLLMPRRVKTFDDVDVDIRPDGSQRYKAKTTSEPCWVVEIKMPRRYVDEFNADVVSVDEDNYVDQEKAQNQGSADAIANTPLPIPPSPGLGI